MVTFDSPGAASPDTLEGQVKVDPFGGLGDFVPGMPPPPPQTPNIGVDENGEVVEMDFGDFDGVGQLAALFGTGTPAVKQEGEEGKKAEEPAAQAAPSASADPPAQTPPEQKPAADDVLNQLSEREREVLSNLRSGNLEKELAMITEFQKDPVGFVDRFVPEIRAEIVHRAAADVLTPSEYAEQYAEARLIERYGENFEFNPADVAIRGSESARYLADRQTLLTEGVMQYNSIKGQEQQAQQQKQIEVEQTAKAVLVRHGIAEEHYAEVIRMAEALPATPETYYDMLFTYMKAKELVKPAAQAPHAQPSKQTATSKPGQSLPPSIPTGGGLARPHAEAEAKELLDLFGVAL